MTKQLELIDVNPSHIDLLYNWRNQDHIREVMFDSREIAYYNHKKWFSSVLENENVYYKVLTVDHVPYGVANFHYTNKNDRIGYWGFYIGEVKAPKGMGTILCTKMLDFLFWELNVHKVCAEVLAFNERSLGFHEKMGFKKEGILKEHTFKDNKYIDVHLYGIFKSEWTLKKSLLNKKNS